MRKAPWEWKTERGRQTLNYLISCCLRSCILYQLNCCRKVLQESMSSLSSVCLCLPAILPNCLSVCLSVSMPACLYVCELVCHTQNTHAHARAHTHLHPPSFLFFFPLFLFASPSSLSPFFTFLILLSYPIPSFLPHFHYSLCVLPPSFYSSSLFFFPMFYSFLLFHPSLPQRCTFSSFSLFHSISLLSSPFIVLSFPQRYSSFSFFPLF